MMEPETVNQLMNAFLSNAHALRSQLQILSTADFSSRSMTPSFAAIVNVNVIFLVRTFDELNARSVLNVSNTSSEHIQICFCWLTTDEEASQKLQKLKKKNIFFRLCSDSYCNLAP